MRAALAAIGKRALMAAGQYRRVLSSTTFPGVAVLCYHGIREDDLPRGAMAFEELHVHASVFESHCRFIRSCCDPISLDDWRAAVAGKAALPPRPVLITFDDGYRSVLRLGAPILQAFDLPAVVFVCSGPAAERRLLWFDALAERAGEDAVQSWKLRQYESWRDACAQTPAVEDRDPRALMTPDEVGALAGLTGIEIGGHTVRHPILARASCVRQSEEILPNLDALRRWTARPVRAFAYPNGRVTDYTRETVDILQGAGVDAAFTTEEAFSRAGEPALERSRFVMLDTVSAAELAHRLAFSWSR